MKMHCIFLELMTDVFRKKHYFVSIRYAAELSSAETKIHSIICSDSAVVSPHYEAFIRR